MKITQKTKRLLLANTVVAVIVGVLAMHYLAPSQLAKADPINSTDFVMTIDTRKGVGNTFTIPTFGGGYNYNVSCGNGVTLTGQTGNAVCSYAAAGEYQIRISGAFPRIFFNFTGDKLKVISIDQWGTNEWLNMEHAFDGAENLDVKATDKPRMGKVVSLAYMFRDAKNLKGTSADWQWDTANVQSLDSTFSGAHQFNQDISNWNTAKVTNMNNTFTNAYEFNQPIQKWDVSKVTTMVAVLAYAKKFNQPIGQWNTARLANALLALAGTEKFDQSLAHWDVRQLTNADGLLNGVKISTPNYDATLIAWQGQTVNNNVKLGGGNSKFCLADAQRSNLVNTKSWIIADAGKDCTPYAVTAVDYTGVMNVDENSAVGTVLGRLTSTDAVGSPQSDFTYTLGCAGAQNNLVTIDGNTIKLARSPDYEQNTTLAICVRSTNKAGQTFDKHLTITVNNLLTLSYNANGADAGTVPASTGETLRSGATVAVAANTGNLVKVGHTFTGWNTMANGGGAAYAAGTTVTVTADTTLYAQWQVNNYTLHFDTKGGSSVPDQTVAFGAKATAPTAPTKTGHTFTGWYKDAGFTQPWDFTIDTMPAADTTLHAKWTVNQYKVHYDANTGSGATPDTVGNYDATVQLANSNFTKTGHTFTGWNTMANGGGTAYAAGDNFHLTGDVTLYAQWRKNNYTLTFDSKGGSPVPSQTVEYGAKVTEPTPPTKTGHTFAGWYKDAGFANPWNFGTDTMPDINATLYAKWTVNQYKIHYNANTGAGTMSDTVGNYNSTVQIAANSFTKAGHAFTGWNTEANGTGTPYAAGANIQLTGDVTLYAQWRDSQPPVTPAAAPDMTAASDTGDSNSDNITNKTKPAFTLMCTEAGSTLTLYVDGVANGTVNCTGPGPVNVAPITPLSEGNHTITFTETDAAGNASQSSPALTVTIDTTAPAAPAVTVDSVTADNTINAAEAAAPQIIRGLATGTRPGDKVRVTVNGTTYETTVDGTGAFAVTVPGAELVSDPDHTIDVTVIASDVAGNTTSTSMTKTYNVDADVVAPPAKATLKSSSDSGASDSDNITNNTTPTVILQCISATDKLHLIVDGVEVQTINCTAVGPVEVTLPNALNDGNHTVVYRRETPAGNISAPSTPLTLTIDTIAPTGTLGTQQATTASPALSGTVTDSAAKVTVTINGVDYPATVAGGTWTLPANVIAALGNGVHTVKLTFTDIAGNTSTVTRPLTITLPTPPTPQPQPGSPNPAQSQNQKKSGTSLADTGDNGYLLIGISSLAVAAGLIGIYRLRRL